MEDNQKLNFKKHLYSSTFQPMEKLVKTKAHVSACTLVLTSFTWLYSEFIKNTKGITRGKHTANALHLCPLPEKAPNSDPLGAHAYLQLLVLQHPTPKAHRKRTSWGGGGKRHENKQLASVSLPGFARAKPQKFLIDSPWGKPGDPNSPIMLCKTLKRKGKTSTSVSDKLKALGTLSPFSDCSWNPQGHFNPELVGVCGKCVGGQKGRWVPLKTLV